MNKENNPISRIIILGGGSSGWISAAYLSKALKNVSITVIESENIARIGVGEATIPSIKNELFDFLEIPEEEWMPKAQGSYKLGIKYSNWRKNRSEKPDDYFYHPFSEVPLCDDIPLSSIWNLNKTRCDRENKPYEYSCFTAPYICDKNLSPKYLDGKKEVHYAYHFDALLVADFLAEWSMKRGVKRVIDNIDDIKLDVNGSITKLIGRDKKSYEADLFIDCTGFASVLLEKTLKEPFVSFSESLLTDSAVAVNIPYKDNQIDIRPYTTATALSSGWAWEIPLQTRSGNGYVYSSKFLTPDQAEKELRDYFGDVVKDEPVRHIKFKSGRHERAWVKNCVGIGLSYAFLEPLESTGIHFVYASLRQLIKCFPDKSMNPILQNEFNKKVTYMVNDVRDFIILHFCTSPREDTPFWKANKYDIKVPESLKEIFNLHKSGLPFRQSYKGNLDARFDRFWTYSNYIAILLGVGLHPENTHPLLSHRPDIIDIAKDMFQDIQLKAEKAINNLPSHAEYLSKMQ
jgi:tryptophan 7-halogenase